MFERIAILLLVLWLVGVVVSYTLKGLIPILLIVAFVMLIVRLVRRRPAITDNRAD